MYKSLFLLSLTSLSILSAEMKPIPEKMRAIMEQPKYAHSNWGLFVKDLDTGTVIYDINSEIALSLLLHNLLKSSDNLYKR